MIKCGSIVRWRGNDKVFPAGKLLSVHEAKDGRLVVWLRKDGRWSKKAIWMRDVEEVLE
jgi:hypothetical protein